MSHPLALFKYCPKCGSSLFEEHNFKSKHCPNCGFTYYQNPSSATAAFIVRSPGEGQEDELLVVRRAKEPAKGTLDLPGGFVDNDETGEQGVIREVREETGLDIREVAYLFSIPNLYHYSGMDIHTLDMFYLCRADEHAIAQASDDAADCMWLPLKDICAAHFGLRSIREGVSRFLERNC